MKQWKAALIDRRAGAAYKEIAEKYGVTVNTVKSWARRHWKANAEDKEAAKGAEGLQPSSMHPPADTCGDMSAGGPVFIDAISSASVEELLYAQIQELTLKAQYLKRKINELDSQDTGLCVDSVTTTRGKEGKPGTITTARPVIDVIIKLEAELDKTQGRMTTVIKTLMHCREERARLILESRRSVTR